MSKGMTISMLWAAALLVACQSPQAAVDTQEMWIADQLVDCVGVGPMRCMQVKTDPNADWGLFYDQIVGFTFVAGQTYHLRVRVERLTGEIPEDASSLVYHLVEILPVE